MALTTEAIAFQRSMFSTMDGWISSPFYGIVKDAGVAGRVMHDRSIMILKASLVESIANNAGYRAIIEKEASYPPLIFVERANIREWLCAQPDVFYEVSETWGAKSTDIKGFKEIALTAVYCKLGYPGGTHDSFSEAMLSHLPTEVDFRRQSVIEWAIEQNDKLANSVLFESDETKKMTAKLFAALIYNVLLVAQNDDNLTEKTRWDRIRASLVGWLEFGKFMTSAKTAVHAPPITQSSSIDVNLSLLTSRNLLDFYDERYVYLYNPNVNNVELLRSPDMVSEPAANVPLSAQDSDHIYVRGILDYIGSSSMSDASLVALTFHNSEGHAVAFSPEFQSDVYEYSLLAPGGTYRLLHTALHRHTVVTIPVTVEITEASTVITIECVSQDGLDSKTYTITVLKFG